MASDTMQLVTVRKATRDDMTVIHRMIHELAAYEGVPDGPELSVEDLIKDGFESSPPWFFAYIAESGGEPVGYALCNRAYSSWTRQAFYVEDLYVKPDQRRKGIGRKLLAALCRDAAAAGASRIDWHVLEDNPPARAFYASIGAKDLRDHEQRAALRLYREGILKLAEEDDSVQAKTTADSTT